ncbi:MAG: hypothetical protein ACREJR_01340 [Candidatus Rokuibacteriota bacterium]
MKTMHRLPLLVEIGSPRTCGCSPSHCSAFRAEAKKFRTGQQLAHESP